MKTFTDKEGGEWNIEVTIGSLSRARDLLSINLGDLRIIADVASRLRFDDVFVADVAWALCKPQCDSKRINREKFCELLGPDSIAAISNGIGAELSDFFRDSTARQTAKAAIELSNQNASLAKQWLGKASAILTSLSTPGAPPATSESIPAASP